MKVKRTKGAVYNLNYHLVWCPKYRRKILTCAVATRTAEILKEVAAKWKLEIIAQEVMPDHIHLFVSAPPRFSPAKLAQLFKGTTSYVLRLEFPKLKKKIRKAGTLWSPGYYVGTAGHVSSETIRRYIEESQEINQISKPVPAEAGR